MFIETETTPNPATLKFLPGRVVLGAGGADFPNRESAGRSPLAQRLFALDGVAGVFLGADFITVTKSDDHGWQSVKAAVLGAIMEHFTAGLPVVTAAEGEAEEDFDEADRGIVTQIRELIDTRVRPAVAQDGGDIVFQGFRSGVVYLHLQGSCAGCPSSTATLKMGIENMLRHYVPEVTSVRAVA